jgi:TolB-like protein
MYRFTNVVIFIVFFLISATFSQPYRIAIIPFTINAEEDISYLQDGIYDIISARLSKTDTISIINREEVEKILGTAEKVHGESLALIVGAKLQAQYVIYGSLTASGENISILAKVVDVSGEKSSLAFSEHVQEKDKVIPKINIFITEMYKYIISSKVAKNDSTGSILPQSMSPPLPAQVTTEKPAKKRAGRFRRTRNLEHVEIDTANSIFKEFWKSPTWNISIVGLALGDVNGDGKIDIIILTPDMVLLYRYANKKILKVKDIMDLKDRYPIGIDIADINGNGIPEIFITTLSFTQNQVNSLVLEYDGEQYNVIAKNIPYYLRVVKSNESNPILFGQIGSAEGPFKGKIYKMKWSDTTFSYKRKWSGIGIKTIDVEHKELKYKTDKLIMPSKSINVLGLAYGDIMDKDKNSVVAYDKFNNIKVFNLAGREVWDTHETYGGSTLYYKLPKEETATENFQYLSMRIIIKDINNDGKLEVIVVKNHPFAHNIIGKVRRYIKSHIEVLGWDEYGMSTQCRTRIIHDHIRDFAIDDFDGDGEDEFIAALIIKEKKSVFTTPRSSIITYEIK